jgi:anti-sigma-K factor RskA
MAMTRDPHTALRELLAAHALGALDPDERAAVEAHLEGCAACRAELASRVVDAAFLAEAVEPVAPPALARRRLLRALAAAPPRAAPAAGPLARWRLAAAALLLVSLGAAGGWLASRGERDRALLAVAAERERAAERLAALGRELAAVRDERDALASAMRSMAAPELQLARLGGLGGRTASGRAFFDPARRRAVFTAAGLEPLPPEQTYELWAIAGGRPIPAGTFDVGPQGIGVVAVPEVAAAAVEVWAVTVEPAGGVPQPTGEMVLASS